MRSGLVVEGVFNLFFFIYPRKLINRINVIKGSCYLPSDQQVQHVELKNPYNLANYFSDKMSILDIKATDEKGRVFDIEMQMGEQSYFGKRELYYWGKAFTDQLGAGRNFSE